MQPTRIFHQILTEQRDRAPGNQCAENEKSDRPQQFLFVDEKMVVKDQEGDGHEGGCEPGDVHHGGFIHGILL